MHAITTWRSQEIPARSLGTAPTARASGSLATIRHATDLRTSAYPSDRQRTPCLAVAFSRGISHLYSYGLNKLSYGLHLRVVACYFASNWCVPLGSNTLKLNEHFSPLDSLRALQCRKPSVDSFF